MFFIFNTRELFSELKRLIVLNLTGTNLGETSTRPPSCTTPWQPTINVHLPPLQKVWDSLFIPVTWIATGALEPFIDGGGRPLADCVDDIEVFKLWELAGAELTEELPTLCKSDSEREKLNFEIFKIIN